MIDGKIQTTEEIEEVLYRARMLKELSQFSRDIYTAAFASVSVQHDSPKAVERLIVSTAALGELLREAFPPPSQLRIQHRGNWPDRPSSSPRSSP